MPASTPEIGNVWHAQLLSRLDLALLKIRVGDAGPPRDPANLRATADYCREIAAASDTRVVTNLLQVAEELDAEATVRERSTQRDHAYF